MQAPLIPIILSGGAGARLWPVSRESHPKPFIKLADQQSLLQKTFERASHLPHLTEIMTITNKEYYLKSKAEYEKNAHSCATSFILEPSARNTAPAIALAALKIANQYGPDSVMLVLPADHLITDNAAFKERCELAYQTAASDSCIVTFGIRPTHPETGFGYIECGDAINAAHLVKRFVEKPDAANAELFMAAGNYLWNAGMFCFKAGVILAELELHAPELLTLATACWEKTIGKIECTTEETAEMNGGPGGSVFRSPRRKTDLPGRGYRFPDVMSLDSETFTQTPNISIDYAVMEKSSNIRVVPCDFGWHDIGSWEAYKKLHHTDASGNTILGDAILIDSQNNFVHSETRMVASIGINNLAIIDTPDALLVTHRDRTQDVKNVVQTLKEKSHQSYLTHRTVIRPWGHYTVLEEAPHYKIKRIVVNPGAALSLQYHQHRAEHWVVLAGTAHVINGDKEYSLKPNESAFVPMGTSHRLSNRGETELVIIEVQTGTYVGEDDIIRLEDTYGRIQ